MKPRRQLLSALLIGAIAVSALGCNSESPTNPVDPGDTSPPQTPGNVHARYDDHTQRDWLAWDPSASTNVASYEVHYSTSPSGIDVNLGTVSAAEYEYALPLAPAGTTEYYRLRAVGTNGVASAFTSPLEVVRAGWDGTGPTETPDPLHSDDN